MSINTPHKVTLTEGQIGVILCSLEKSVKSELWFKDSDSDYISEIDGIFEILEGTIDRYYDKIEKHRQSNLQESGKMMSLVLLVLLCFSIQLASDVWR